MNDYIAPSMNKELGKMKTLGLCHICSRPAVRTCGLCGLAVCERHIAKGGVCARCGTSGNRRNPPGPGRGLLK